MTYDTTKPLARILSEYAKKTWKTRHVTVEDGYLRRHFNAFEVDHTDGIGTKGVHHWQYRTFKNAVLDALAMNVNDLAMYGCTPYKLQNHVVVPDDDEEAVTEIAETLSSYCLAHEIAVTGGEYSVHNNIKGMEISITMSGFCERIRKNVFRAGDVLIGLPSSGFHSNGFSFLSDVKKEWLEPTKIYNVPDRATGIQHITGGAFSKLKRPGVDIHLDMGRPPQLFVDRYGDDEFMYKTFNCGFGMILAVPSALPEDVIVGKVLEGSGKVVIKSGFSGRTVTL